LLSELGAPGGSLPGLIDGSLIATVALGDESWVAYGEAASLFLLRHGEELHAVVREDVALTHLPAVDGGRPLCSVEWEPREATLLSTDPAPLAAARDRGALAAAANLIGLADGAPRTPVHYAGEADEQAGRTE